MGLGRWFNSVCTEFWVNWWGTDINDVKSQFLHSAAYYEDINLIGKLISHGANVDLLNRAGNSALHDMVKAGNLPMVNCLASHHANANVLDSSDYTPLYYAFRDNNVDMAKNLLTLGAVFSPDFKGHSTLLHHAVLYGHSESTKFLISIGANANFPDNSGNIPANYALLNRNLETFKLLIPHTYLKAINPVNGKTLLHTAAAKGFKEAVEILIQADVHPSIVDKDGCSPIGEAITHGHINIAQMLLQAGGEFDIAFEGAELINKAAANGHTSSIGFLIEFGVDVNAYDKYGNIPIYYAKTNEMLDFLCKHGAIVDFKDKYGYTSLHKAVRAGELEKVKILLKHNANPDTINNDRLDSFGSLIEGKSALYDALSLGYGKIASFLFHSIDSSRARGEFIVKAKIMGSEIITEAAKKGNDSVIDFYYEIKSYGRPDLTDTIYHALSNNRPTTASKLEWLGATFNPNIQKHINLLNLAVQNKWYDTTIKLLKLGVNPNAGDFNSTFDGKIVSHTALYYAIENSDKDMLNILLHHKANPNMSGSNKHNVFHAIEKGNVDILKALLDKGGDMFATDSTGQTTLMFALKLAASNNFTYSNVVDFLVSHTELPHNISFLNTKQQQLVDWLSKEDPVTGKSLLQLAISAGQVNAAKKLLDNKFTAVDLKADFEEILKLSDASSKITLIKALFASPNFSIDIDSKYFNNGQTLLHKAAESGCKEVVEYLKSQGASLTIKDDQGNTPVDVAILKYYPDSFLAILMPPVSNTPTDKMGDPYDNGGLGTPLHKDTPSDSDHHL